jgi:hypothetical protein
VLGFDSQERRVHQERTDASNHPASLRATKPLLLGYFSLHGGVNYSLERADGDKDINMFIGAEDDRPDRFACGRNTALV